MAHERSWREGRRRGGSWGIGEGTGRKTSPFPYLRRRHSSWRKAKGWGEKPSPSPIQCRWEHDGTRPDRWDAPCPMRWCLVRQDVGWAWPTTTACRARETRCNRMQAALCLPRQDLKGPNNGISTKERPTGLLSRSNGSGKCRETGKEHRDAPCEPC